MTEDFIDAEHSTRLLTQAAPPETPRLLPPPRRPQTMTDQFLLQLTEEIVKPLSDGEGDSPCMAIVPSYNAILSAAQANHPNHPFLSLLSPVEKDGFINVSQILALFAQLRIVLESLQTAPQP